MYLATQGINPKAHMVKRELVSCSQLGREGGGKGGRGEGGGEWGWGLKTVEMDM